MSLAFIQKIENCCNCGSTKIYQQDTSCPVCGASKFSVKYKCLKCDKYLDGSFCPTCATPPANRDNPKPPKAKPKEPIRNPPPPPRSSPVPRDPIPSFPKPEPAKPRPPVFSPKETPDKESKSSDNTPVLIGALVGILLLAGLVGFGLVFLLNNRGSQTSNPGIFSADLFYRAPETKNLVGEWKNGEAKISFTNGGNIEIKMGSYRDLITEFGFNGKILRVRYSGEDRKYDGMFAVEILDQNNIIIREEEDGLVPNVQGRWVRDGGPKTSTLPETANGNTATPAPAVNPNPYKEKIVGVWRLNNPPKPGRGQFINPQTVQNTVEFTRGGTILFKSESRKYSFDEKKGNVIHIYYRFEPPSVDFSLTIDFVNDSEIAIVNSQGFGDFAEVAGKCIRVSQPPATINQPKPKPNPWITKIIGKWEIVNPGFLGLGGGAVEFTRDGNMKLSPLSWKYQFKPDYPSVVQVINRDSNKVECEITLIDSNKDAEIPIANTAKDGYLGSISGKLVRIK